jgi:hypothetical protein
VLTFKTIAVFLEKAVDDQQSGFTAAALVDCHDLIG